MWKRCLPSSALVAIVALAQSITDLIDRCSGFVHSFGVNCLPHTNCTMTAMRIAEAVQQAVMAMEPIASAVAMHLGKQFGMFARHAVRLVCRPLVKAGIQGHDVVPGPPAAAGSRPACQA